MSVSNLAFSTIIATLIPSDGSAPIQYFADTTFDEEEFLGEPQPAKERGRRFMSNDGQFSQVIQRYASNGKRDITIFDGSIADAIISIGQANPFKIFDYSFQYQRDQNDADSIRIHYHSDCFIENTPMRAISNEVAVIKCTINYGKIQLQDRNGAAI